MERTLVLLKPDCVQRRLMGQVISRFENKGFNIIAMKMLQVTPDLAKQHYAEHVEKPFYPGLETFITGAPVLAMIIEGLDVIQVVR
ncbi:MAG: nucleoside-diphosphate kinase, partial [Pirellulaceae bacterium]